MTPSLEFELLLNGIGVVYGFLLLWGLNRRWQWIIDPPVWLFLLHFPAFVKMIWGPRYVMTVTVAVAWISIILSVSGVVLLVIRLV